jgi:hypothetical protein
MTTAPPLKVDPLPAIPKRLPPLTVDRSTACAPVDVGKPLSQPPPCSPALRSAFLLRTLPALPLGGSNAEQIANTAMALLAEMGPLDAVAELIAHQLVAVHLQAMEMLRLSKDTMLPESRQIYLNQANKLFRTYATLAETLRKHLQRGQQTMVVEHVHVHDGGQAIVGQVSPLHPDRGGRADD